MGFLARLCLSLFLAAASLPMAGAGPAAAAPADFTVQAGAVPGGPPTGWAVWAMLFEPSSMTIDAGDSVTWTSEAMHTVTFGTLPHGVPNTRHLGGTSYSGTGTVNSGPLAPGQRFTLSFPRVGTYTYRCLFHPASMKGTIVVQPAGSPYPVAPASDRPASSPAFTAALAAGRAAMSAQTVSRSVEADGTTTWRLAAGLGDGKSYAVERFGASDLTIHTGDTVVWSQDDPNEVHTVSFLGGGPDVPQLLPNGDPNPRASAPAGGKVYAGSGFASSGFLKSGRSYALTFSRAGTFQYRCLIHDDFGMVATLTVVAAAAPARPPLVMPSTGGGGGSTPGGLILCGLLALTLGLTTQATRRAQRRSSARERGHRRSACPRRRPGIGRCCRASGVRAAMAPTRRGARSAQRYGRFCQGQSAGVPDRRVVERAVRAATLPRGSVAPGRRDRHGPQLEMLLFGDASVQRTRTPPGGG